MRRGVPQRFTEMNQIFTEVEDLLEIQAYVLMQINVQKIGFCMADEDPSLAWYAPAGGKLTKPVGHPEQARDLQQKIFLHKVCPKPIFS